jgi:hypothetical protein
MTKVLFQSFADWEIQRKEVQNHDMRDRKDLDRQITKDCGPLIRHEEGS